MTKIIEHVLVVSFVLAFWVGCTFYMGLIYAANETGELDTARAWDFTKYAICRILGVC